MRPFLLNISKLKYLRKLTQLSNKGLGNVFVHFGDMVVVGHHRTLFPARDVWQLREYPSSMFVITVKPIRVQP